MADEPQVKGRTITVREPPRTPWMGFILGNAAMVPLAAAAAIACFGPGQLEGPALRAACTWSGALLAFFAGVRRGVSFRTEGGPRWRQIGLMLALFLLALATLSLAPRWALLAALTGFLLLLLLDPPAAERGEAPLYFARLRPLQMLVPVASLLVLVFIASDGPFALYVSGD